MFSNSATTPSQWPLNETAAINVLRQQLAELRQRRISLDKRIQAFDSDINWTLDAEKKLALKERREALSIERDGIVASMIDIEQKLGL